jgi:exodeoxyribonuclease VII large subunit
MTQLSLLSGNPPPEEALPTPSPPPADALPLTVSELTQQLKRTLATHPVLGGKLLVQGELSNVKASSRGHVYLTLKDEGASISGVLWASKAKALPFTLADGLAVIATGELDVYAPNGSYSLVISKLEPVGQGALQLTMQQLQHKLQAEGLFDADRKRPLPAFPLRIGMVTAATGAVIHDMMRIIRAKNSLVDVVLAPVKVQGEGAASSIAQAIEGLQEPLLGVELIIVARGGGSFEDLYCFSEEAVVRAITACRVPVVTGIGHEPDFGLADAVADYSAPTPTAAADKCVPDVEALRYVVAEAGQAMGRAVQHRLALAQHLLDAQTEGLRLGLDRSSSHAKQHLATYTQALQQAMAQQHHQQQHKVAMLAATLNAYSPLATLARGYAVVSLTEGSKVINHSQQVIVGDTIQCQLATGSLKATVTAVL